MKKRGFFSLSFQVFIFSAVCGLLPLLLTMTLLNDNFQYFLEDRLETEVLEIAMWASQDARVKEAYTAKPVQAEALEEFAQQIKNQTNAYVNFIDEQGIVLTQPDPSLTGEKIEFEEERALKGEIYVSRIEGYAGPAIRCFAPIYVNDIQVGTVIAAFLEPDIKHILSQLYRSVSIVLPLGLLLIVMLSLLLANNIKKRLFGMEPLEIGTKLMEREGILHSVNEGIIATDHNLEITVVNQKARELFPKDVVLEGKKITDLIPDSPLVRVIISKRPEYNKQLSIYGNIVLYNSFPLFINNRVVGIVMTIRPMTEVSRLAEELTGFKEIVQALRARTHEFSNKLHAISGLLQLGSYEEAKKYAASVAQDERTLLSCILNNFGINAISGLLMGKASEAEERRIKFSINPESYLFSLPESFDEHSCVIVLGNLIENAFDAVEDYAAKPEVAVSIQQTESAILFEVKDNGPGIPSNIQQLIFQPGYTTKPHGMGYGLSNVKNKVDLAQGELTFYTDSGGTIFRVRIPHDALQEQGGGDLDWN